MALNPDFKALQEIKPKNARSARALSLRAPLPHENPKRILLLRGTKTSSLLSSLQSDLSALLSPSSSSSDRVLKFTKKNDIHPFADASSLEFFAQKNDTSLAIFASHSKKRPHTLTWIRCFNGAVLDMVETHVDAESSRLLSQFSKEGRAGVKVGIKPMLSFSGSGWEGEGEGGDKRLGRAKSLFVDFFRGEEAKEVDVEGLQLLISFFAEDASLDSSEEELGPKVYMRCYKISTKKASGSKTPYAEVHEVGPRLDLRIGRIKEPDPQAWKESMKKAKEQKEKVKKNVETDIMGDKLGRIHIGKQDLSALQTRKMKGLKRGRDDDAMIGEGEDVVSEDESFEMDGIDGGIEIKRQRIA